MKKEKNKTKLFTLVYRGIQGYTRVFKGIQGVYSHIQGFTGVYKGIQGYKRVQNHAARVVTFSNYNHSTDELLQMVNWVKLD